ncbi:MAG TPA: nucleotidyltransferase domain-containing protein [Nevskiaceae bacterium]|nr:nucleotidyltransferase domain-containing protein [Nevskiaceae bacterium]
MPKDFNFHLQQVVEEIRKKYKPEKIILFGSAARGKTRKWSDADLVVIKKTKKRFYDRIEEVSLLVEHNIPLDFLVYTPKEFREMAGWNYFVQKEILKKGKILYES